MTPEQWRRVNDLYHAALDTPTESRARFVHDHASDDHTVAHELQRLLEVDPGKTAVVDKAAVNLRLLLAPVIAPGDHIASRYRILGEVGAGGMGQVYEAVDDELKTRVALKIIRPELANEPRVVARFKQEIQLARQVTHPNVCRAFDLIRVKHRERELLVLCMEFVDGETLSTLLRRDGKMKLAQAEPIIQQIAAGLDAAHAAGVVHRDLKSGNIFLSKTREGELRVVLADFGLAGSLAPDDGVSRQTTSGWGIGTPAYMAPEQVEGGKIGPAADIYALGVVMYEMATGQVPYEGQTPLQVAVRRLREKPRPPRELDASVDGRWESAILRCLEVSPEDRFASAAGVASALHQLSWLPRTPNRQWRRRIAAAAAVAIVAAGAGVYWGRSRGVEIPPQASSWYNRGLTALYDGNWPDAERAFTQTIQAAPAYAAAYARRAEAQIEMDRIDDARASLLEGVDAGILTAEQKLHLDAVRAYLNRDMEKSANLLAQRASLEKDDIVAKLDWARALMRRGQVRRALQPYRDVVAKDPGLTAAWIQLGNAAARDGQGEESDGAFQRAAETLQRYPNPGTGKDLAYYRADAARVQNRPNRTELAQAAVRLAESPVDFRNVRARLLQAGLLARAGKAGDSRRVAQAATEDARKNNLDLLAAQGLSDLGFQLLTQGEFEQGSELMRESIRLSEKLGAQRTLAKAQVDLGFYLTNGCQPGRLTEARSLTKSVLGAATRGELLDLRIEARLNTVKILTCDGDLVAAEKAGQEHLADAQRSPDRSYVLDAYSRLSGISRLRLRLRESRERIQQAAQIACELEQRPRCLDMRMRVAMDDFSRGLYDDSLRALLALEKEAPPNTALEIRRNRALVLSEMGRSVEALALLTELEKPVDAARKQSAFSGRVALARCITEAEAHQYPSARKSCGALLDNPETSPARRTSAKGALAQAAYWGGDYATALRLAGEVTLASEKDSPFSQWPTLLTRTAAAKRLGGALPPLLSQMAQFVHDLRQQNGSAETAVFLQKRPYQEFLKEIGYSALN